MNRWVLLADRESASAVVREPTTALGWVGTLVVVQEPVGFGSTEGVGEVLAPFLESVGGHLISETERSL